MLYLIYIYLKLSLTWSQGITNFARNLIYPVQLIQISWKNCLSKKLTARILYICFTYPKILAGLYYKPYSFCKIYPLTFQFLYLYRYQTNEVGKTYLLLLFKTLKITL